MCPRVVGICLKYRNHSEKYRNQRRRKHLWGGGGGSWFQQCAGKHAICFTQDKILLAGRCPHPDYGGGGGGGGQLPAPMTENHPTLIFLMGPIAIGISTASQSYIGLWNICGVQKFDVR